MLRLTAGTATHPGHRRERNEDAILAGSHLFAVADGMGGHTAGDVASAIVVEQLLVLADAPDLDRGTVLSRIREADQQICRRGATTTSGMGTTVSGLAFLGSGSRRILVFNVGDSRVYRLRDHELSQLTHDHSVVQDLLDQGAIEPEELATHPDRHVITRSLGTGGPLDIDWWHLDPQPGDRYLITSDGLTKEVDAPRIADLLSNDTAPQDTAAALVESALEAGGSDNVAVVVVDVITATASPSVAEGLIDPLDYDTAERIDALVGAEADTTPTSTLVQEAPESTVVATTEADRHS